MKRAAWILALLCACSGGDDESRVDVPGREGAHKSSATVRAARRAYDGAPPVIPHAAIGGVECTTCHDERGMDVPELGFAPPSPHERTAGLSAISRCTASPGS